jgi:regulatory protein
MSLIGAIERQKRGRGVDIVVDGEVWITVHRDVVFECGVRRGDPATPELLERLQTAEAEHRTYEAALSLISYRPRSEGELRQRLLRKGLPEAAIGVALDRLRRSGLVNDEQFARAWVEGRGAGAGGRGKSLLSAELRAKGVAPDLISGAVDGRDDESRAFQAARPRAARLSGLDYEAFRRRLSGFLQRRGFGYGVTNTVVRALWQERGAGDSGAADVD